MSNEIKTISNSQLGQWIRCPRQWEFRYVKGLKVPPGGAAVQGTAYHGGLKENFKYKIHTGVDMPLADVQDAFNTHWTAETTNPREETDDDVDAEPISDKVVLWDDKNPGELKDEGLRLLQLYHTSIAPSVKPVAVEKKSEIKIGDTLLLGYIDVEEND